MWQRAATPRSTLSRFRRRGLPAAPRQPPGGSHASALSRAARGSTCTRTPSWPACAASRRPCIRRCAASAPRRRELLDAGRLAGRARLHPRGDGGHGRVLEAGVARAEGRLRAGAGQRRAHPQRARSQDRRQRRDVDRRPARARPDPLELRAAAGDPAAARPDPHPQAARAGGLAALAAHPEGARRRQPQAGQRALGRAGQERAGDARCHRRRPERSGAAGRARPGHGAQQDRRAARGAARTHHRAPPHDAQAASAGGRCPAAHARRAGHRSGKSAGADPPARPPLDDDARGH